MSSLLHKKDKRTHFRCLVKDFAKSVFYAITFFKMEVGLRIVRGRDWKFANQDGGEGHVGTVVKWLKPYTERVVVKWDSGSEKNYRIGYKDTYNLKVLDNAPLGIVHPHVVCGSCYAEDIGGMRWKCQVCENFDLCSQCYMADKHDLTHKFTLFETPNSVGVNVPERRNAKKISMKGIFPGAKVIRGPDWDWEDQDGGKEVGTVISIENWKNKYKRCSVSVRWPSGFTDGYRVGYKGMVDLIYREPASGGHYYRDHLPILKYSEAYALLETENLKNVSSEKNKNYDTNMNNAAIKEAEVGDRKVKGFIQLSQNFEDLFVSGELCDFTIKIHDRKFQIHKAVLGARSPVFASMFMLDMKERNSGEVELSDCNPDIFDDFLFYLYSGNSERISFENVFGLYEASEKYNIQLLKEECAHFMKGSLCVDFICDILTLAITFKDMDLLQHATNYFNLNTKEILCTVKWQNFVKENPVSANELYIKAFSFNLQ